jgi:hypothetical protein
VFTESFPNNESACHNINEKFDRIKFCVKCGEVEVRGFVEQREEWNMSGVRAPLCSYF